MPPKPEFAPRGPWHELAEFVRAECAFMRRGDGSLEWAAVLACVRGLDLGPFAEEFVLGVVGDLEHELLVECNRKMASK